MLPAWPTLTAAAALALVLGLIWLAQRVAKHKLTRPRGRLALAETIALDSRRRLHLIRCDGQFMLLATGGPQDLALGWLADADRANRQAEPPPTLGAHRTAA